MEQPGQLPCLPARPSPHLGSRLGQATTVCKSDCRADAATAAALPPQVPRAQRSWVPGGRFAYERSRSIEEANKSLFRIKAKKEMNLPSVPNEITFSSLYLTKKKKKKKFLSSLNKPRQLPRSNCSLLNKQRTLELTFLSILSMQEFFFFN